MVKRVNQHISDVHDKEKRQSAEMSSLQEGNKKKYKNNKYMKKRTFVWTEIPFS